MYLGTLGTQVEVVTGMKGINYAVFGISNTLNRQLDYKSKVGIGLMMEYIGSRFADYCGKWKTG